MTGKEGLMEELQDAGRYLFVNGLVWGNAGNISARTSEHSCIISASGSRVGNLRLEDLVDCPFDGAHRCARRPSKELPMHAAVYAARPEVGAVLHSSPFYSTLIACTDLPVPADLFVEDMYYLERVERVSYCHPGSAALAQAVASRVSRANVLLLEHHGVLVYDESIPEALMALHTLEIVCRMVVEGRRSSLPLNSLAPEKVEDFLERSGYRPRRRWEYDRN